MDDGPRTGAFARGAEAVNVERAAGRDAEATAGTGATGRRAASPARREAALATLAAEGALSDDFPERALTALVEGLGCRVAGLARTRFPLGQASVIALAGRGGEPPAGRLDPPLTFDLEGTPCGRVYDPASGGLFCVPDEVLRDFRLPEALHGLGPRSYCGLVIPDANGQPLGHLFLIGDSAWQPGEEETAFIRLIGGWLGSDYRRQLAEQACGACEQRFRNTVEASAHGIVVLRGEKPVFANLSFARIFGYDAVSEVLALESIAGIAPEACAEGLRSYLRDLMMGRSDVEMLEIGGRGRDGERHWLRLVFRPIDWDGLPAVQCSVIDETQSQRVEAALRRAKEEAERANETKTRFLAAASHDLRQPLHALRLLVAALPGCKDEDEREVITGEIRAGLGNMSGILNALLDVSELDAGGVQPQLREFPADELLRGVVDSLARRAADKRLELRFQPSRALLRSDPALLGRIVTNLLANAVQYTESGRILVGCRRLGGVLRVEVWDTGSGIPADKQQQVFEEFCQLDNPGRDREKGLGLGLAIVDRLARLLGHRLSLESTPGRGSVFRVEVPLAGRVEPASAASRSGKEAGFDLSGQVFLIIEDDAAVRDATERLLAGWGARVVAATGARHALQRLENWSRPPDAIIADLHLPFGVDGVAAIASLRERLGAEIPAAILTGEASPQRLRAIEREGLPVLRKPTSPEALKTCIAGLLRQ